MDVKHTLKLDQKIVEEAAKYALEDGKTVSQTVEQFLKKFIQARESPKKEGSIMELKGILGKVPDDFDYREERYKYLIEKHK